MLLNEFAHNWSHPTHNHGLDGSGDEEWRTITRPNVAAIAAIGEWVRTHKNKKYSLQQMIDFASKLHREKKLSVDREEFLKEFRNRAIKGKLADEIK